VEGLTDHAGIECTGMYTKIPSTMVIRTTLGSYSRIKTK